MTNNELEPDDMKHLKAVIANEIFQSPYCKDKCEFFHFEDAAGEKYHQGVIGLNLDDNVNAIFSIPVDGKNVFILISDGDEKLLRTILANIEEVDRAEQIKLGNVLLIKSELIVSKDIVGVIFLPVGTSNILNYLPDGFECSGVTYKFFLVVFLTNIEHEIWLKDGHDSLMNYFSQINKDLMSF